jgi:hypothetical protein
VLKDSKVGFCFAVSVGHLMTEFILRRCRWWSDVAVVKMARKAFNSSVCLRSRLSYVPSQTTVPSSTSLRKGCVQSGGVGVRSSSMGFVPQSSSDSMLPCEGGAAIGG